MSNIATLISNFLQVKSENNENKEDNENKEEKIKIPEYKTGDQGWYKDKNNECKIYCRYTGENGNIEFLCNKEEEINDINKSVKVNRDQVKDKLCYDYERIVSPLKEGIVFNNKFYNTDKKPKELKDLRGEFINYNNYGIRDSINIKGDIINDITEIDCAVIANTEDKYTAYSYDKKMNICKLFSNKIDSLEKNDRLSTSIKKKLITVDNGLYNIYNDGKCVNSDVLEGNVKMERECGQSMMDNFVYNNERQQIFSPDKGKCLENKNNAIILEKCREDDKQKFMIDVYRNTIRSLDKSDNIYKCLEIKEGKIIVKDCDYNINQIFNVDKSKNIHDKRYNGLYEGFNNISDKLFNYVLLFIVFSLLFIIIIKK